MNIVGSVFRTVTLDVAGGPLVRQINACFILGFYTTDKTSYRGISEILLSVARLTLQQTKTAHACFQAISLCQPRFLVLHAPCMYCLVRIYQSVLG